MCARLGAETPTRCAVTAAHNITLHIHRSHARSRLSRLDRFPAPTRTPRAASMHRRAEIHGGCAGVAWFAYSTAIFIFYLHSVHRLQLYTSCNYQSTAGVRLTPSTTEQHPNLLFCLHLVLTLRLLSIKLAHAVSQLYCFHSVIPKRLRCNLCCGYHHVNCPQRKPRGTQLALGRCEHEPREINLSSGDDDDDDDTGIR